MDNNITFIIAVQIDSQDRLANLDLVVNCIREGFPSSPLLLLEADITSKLAGRYTTSTLVYHKLGKDGIFNKMRLYNKGAKLANTSALCFVDADVPPSKQAVMKAYSLIVKNTYEVVYPYGKGEGYNVPREFHEDVRGAGDIYTYDKNKYPWLAASNKIDYVESGGIILFNTAAYCYGGGGNETFVRWGCEDDEMLYRFKTLGYRIGRVDEAVLLHLDHTRKTGTAWHAAFLPDGESYEVANRIKLSNIKRMSKEELWQEAQGWNNFGGLAVKEKLKGLTVVVSGSYLESHPEITFVKEVVESLVLTGIACDTPIILSHDKIKPGAEGYTEKQANYEKYFENLKEYASKSPFTNIQVIEAPEWGHLTRSLKHAVSLVKTKYMLMLQHDIHIRREIPVLDMIDLMENHPHIKHLRFNVRKNLPTFMWWDGYQGGKQQFHEEEYDGVKVCFTPAWSDQNHLATKEYYENVVFPDCTNSDGELIYDFMENRLNGLCHHNHERYGTYIYGAYGEPRTSRHSDGRKSSPEADED